MLVAVVVKKRGSWKQQTKCRTSQPGFWGSAPLHKATLKEPKANQDKVPQRERGMRIQIWMIYSFRPLLLIEGCRWMIYYS